MPQRRGYWIVRDISRELTDAGLATEPDFNWVYIDAPVTFVKATHESNEPAEVPSAEETAGIATVGIEVVGGGALVDPTYRIGKLTSANRPPQSVPPDATVAQAVTTMLASDFSQLPVMQGERDVKGVVSWSTIGKRLSMGVPCNFVRDCMEPAFEISSDVSIFSAIDSIVEHEYALIRDRDNTIIGIVTTSDLSLQFKDLGEPFLLIGEIENHVRRMIGDKFTLDDLRAVRDPSDGARPIDAVSDLTFGEYIRLLEDPQRWDNLGLTGIDRKVFIAKLDAVREIRNDVMHFDPDGVPPEVVDGLRDFIRLMRTLREIRAI